MRDWKDWALLVIMATLVLLAVVTVGALVYFLAVKP